VSAQPPGAALQGEKGLYPAKGRCSLAPEVGQGQRWLETRVPHPDVVVGLLLVQHTLVVSSSGPCPDTWGFTPPEVLRTSIKNMLVKRIAPGLLFNDTKKVQDIFLFLTHSFLNYFSRIWRNV